jgi:hypothetical protein
MTDQRTPNQKLAEAISFGLEAKGRLQALIETLREKHLIDEADVLSIESRARELAREYEKDIKPR